LDELRQIFNIISGNMSFIGPRQLLLNQDELIHFRTSYKKTTLKPVITGLAQINP
jgi:O-antigen biosynthesis protein WbqP